MPRMRVCVPGVLDGICIARRYPWRSGCESIRVAALARAMLAWSAMVTPAAGWWPGRQEWKVVKLRREELRDDLWFAACRSSLVSVRIRMLGRCVSMRVGRACLAVENVVRPRTFQVRILSGT
jgi:hypothetical protein